MKSLILILSLMMSGFANANEVLAGRELVSNLSGDGAQACKLEMVRDAQGHIRNAQVTMGSKVAGANNLSAKDIDSDHNLRIDNEEYKAKTFMRLQTSEDEKQIHSVTVYKKSGNWSPFGGSYLKNKDIFSCVFY